MSAGCSEVEATQFAFFGSSDYQKKHVVFQSGLQDPNMRSPCSIKMAGLSEKGFLEALSMGRERKRNGGK